VVENNKVGVKSSVTRKETGMYEVSYSSATDVNECEQFSIYVTQPGRHILGSLIFVKDARLLLEFSSSDNIFQDVLDAPMNTMLSVSRARLWVHLCDSAS